MGRLDQMRRKEAIKFLIKSISAFYISQDMRQMGSDDVISDLVMSRDIHSSSVHAGYLTIQVQLINKLRQQGLETYTWYNHTWLPLTTYQNAINYVYINTYIYIQLNCLHAYIFLCVCVCEVSFLRQNINAEKYQLIARFGFRQSN